ncbi:MAG: hypothetical protein ABJP34_03365 [Erythrobacter sp.]
MFTAAIVMMLQASGQTVIAPKPEDPETWVLEYPVVIAPYIDDYYGCLRSRGHNVTAEADPVFEEQHRAHIPLCAKQLEKATASSNVALQGKVSARDYTPQKVAATFKTIEFIHVARGRDIDNRLRLHLDQYATYDAAYDTTPEEVSGGDRIAADLPSSSQPPTTQETSDAQN